MKAQTWKRSTGRTRNAPAIRATFMLTQKGSVGSRNTSLIGSIGWASQVMIRSEKLKVAMKPMAERDQRHHDPQPQLAQVGEEGHAALLDVLGLGAGRQGLPEEHHSAGRRRRRLARVHDERDLAADARGGERRPQARPPSPGGTPRTAWSPRGRAPPRPRRRPPRSPRASPAGGAGSRRARPGARAPELAQPGEPAAGLHRQEALEHEPVRGNPRRRQRRDQGGRRPGSGTTGTPASRQSRTSRKPGSDTPGVPASVTSAIRAPPWSRRRSSGPRRAWLCSK